MAKKLEKQITIVVTILNEADTIVDLLNSLSRQTLMPKEVIIVDGGSKDSTLLRINEWLEVNKKMRIRVLSKQGNRSVGRNLGIAESLTELIAMTDAGCQPQPTWLAELLKAWEQKQAVVAGYYMAQPRKAIEEAVVPYALVMPDRVNPRTFLPATRSMLLTKSVWQKVGGFDESLPDNEDYAFARSLRTKRISISFAKRAVVVWQPRSDLPSFWQMIFRFARGDAYAGLFRPKVALIYIRYLLLGWGLWVSIDRPDYIIFVIFALWLYLGWAIFKNIKYVPHGWVWLPLLQVMSDWAVMLGTLSGLFRRLRFTI